MYMPIKYYHTSIGKSNIRGKGLTMTGYGHNIPAIHPKTIIQELPSVVKNLKIYDFRDMIKYFLFIF